MRYFLLFLLLSLLICSGNTEVQSQTGRSPNKFLIHADYSRFWKNDTAAYVEISTAVYPNLVSFISDSTGRSGKIGFNIIIRSDSNRVDIHNDRFVMPIRQADSASVNSKNMLVNKTTYMLGAGEYNVTVRVYDLNDTVRKHDIFFPLEINKRSGKANLSDIELCSSVSAAADRKDQFYKNTFRVIPQPSGVFGATTSPVLFTYTEFYNIDAKMFYDVKLQIADLKGSIKKTRTQRHRYANTNAVDVSTLNVTSLSSGKYNCEVILSDTTGNEIAKSQRYIYIYNPHVKQESVPAAVLKGSEFAVMSSAELEEEFKKAEYVSSSEDKNIFKRLTTREARGEYLEKFWARIENQSREYYSVTRQKYIQRVSIADQKYFTAGKMGWQTDRGRIYILYGEPDEIERFTYSENTKSYEIWHYYHIETSARFVFIDISGFNEYLLVHSTKNGEVRDENWEEYLKTGESRDAGAR